MSRRIGLQYPGAFEGGSGVLSEIDRALAVIGAAHWMEKYRPSPTRSATKHLDQSAALGHFGWSAPPRLGGRCRIVEATLAGTHRNGRDAPGADIRETENEAPLQSPTLPPSRLDPDPRHCTRCGSQDRNAHRTWPAECA